MKDWVLPCEFSVPPHMIVGNVHIVVGREVTKYADAFAYMIYDAYSQLLPVEQFKEEYLNQLRRYAKGEAVEALGVIFHGSPFGDWRICGLCYNHWKQYKNLFPVESPVQ